MRGVYAVASELSRLGYIASPTSRGAKGADILVTDQSQTIARSIEVKSDKRGTFWLLKTVTVSPSHFYVFVRFRNGESDYYVVPSKVVKAVHRGGNWASVHRRDIEEYKDGWETVLLNSA